MSSDENLKINLNMSLSSVKHLLPQISRVGLDCFASRSSVIASLVILAMLFFAGFFGWAIPFLGILVPALIGVLVLCVLVLTLSPTAIVWLMLFLVLLIVGQLNFFLGIRQTLWLPYLLLLLVSIKFLMEKFRATSRVAATLGLSAVSVLIILFCLFFCLSALVNQTDFASIGVAAKNYVFPWFLTMLVASTIKCTKDLQRIWIFMLWVVAAQMPFAILQRFYFMEHGNWDIVAGTFVLDSLIGGGSGGMAIYLVFGIVLAASLFRQKQIGWKMLAGVVFTALVTVALAEVKVFFFCLPLGLIFLFHNSMLINPIKFIGISLLGMILLVPILFVYQQTYAESQIKLNDVQNAADYVFSAESNPDFFNPRTRELSRVGAILMWERYNKADEYQFYIGHGPASSRESQTLGIGVEARKYPFTLSTSGASSMLWELGLLGYAVFLAILFVCGVSAFRLAHRAPPMEAAVLDSIAVMLLLNLPLSLYNRDLIDSAATQVLLAFWLGYVLLCRKKFAGLNKPNYNISRKIP